MHKEKKWFCQECRILMEYNKDYDYYKCPECNIEVWIPEYSKDKEIKKMAEALSDTIIPVKRKSGSSSKGRSSRRKLLNKKSANQLYKELLEL